MNDKAWAVPHEHNGATVEVRPSDVGHGYIQFRVSSPDNGVVTLSWADWQRINKAAALVSTETAITAP